MFLVLMVLLASLPPEVEDASALAGGCVPAEYAEYAPPDIVPDGTDSQDCTGFTDPVAKARELMSRGEDPEPAIRGLGGTWLSVGLALVSEFHRMRGDLMGALWYATRAVAAGPTVHAILARAGALGELGLVRTAYVLVMDAIQKYGRVPALVREAARLAPMAMADVRVVRAFALDDRALVASSPLQVHVPQVGFMADPRDHAPWRGRRTEILWDARYIRIRHGKASVVHQRILGVARQGGRTFHIIYAPSYRHLRIVRTTLVRHGRIFTDAATVEEKELTPPDARMYFRVSRVDVSFPHTEPGDVLELVYTTQDLPGPELSRRYFGSIVDLQDALPVHRSLVVVDGTDLNVHAPAGAVVGQGSAIEVISLSGVPGRRMEPLGRPRLEYAVQVSGYGTWKELAAEYAAALRSFYGTNPFLKERISGSPAEVVREVSRRLQRMRYVSIMFGIHGYFPYSPEEIIHRRFGDCKDMTLIGVLMLRAAGIDAEPVLVRTRAMPELEPVVPTLAYFDHAMIRLPDGTYMDGAAKGFGYPVLPPWDLGARELRLLNPSENLGTVPQGSASDNTTSVRLELARRRGLWRITISMEMRGLDAVVWRVKGGRGTVAGWFGPLSRVVEYQENEDHGRFLVRCVVDVRARTVPLGLGWRRRWLEWTRLQTRTTRLSLPYPRTVKLVVTGPQGTIARFRDASFGSAPFAFTQRVRGNTMERRWSLDGIGVPPGAYPSFRKAVLGALEVIDEPAR